MLRIFALAVFALPLVSAATLTGDVSGRLGSANCSDSGSQSDSPLHVGCQLSIDPIGGPHVFVNAYADATYGSVSALIENFGNLAFEDPGFNFENSGLVNARFEDGISFGIAQSGFLQVVAIGTGAYHHTPNVILGLNGQEFDSIEGQEIDTGLIPADLSVSIPISLLLSAFADADNGLNWDVYIETIRIYDGQGQQISGFTYSTDSDSAYNVDGGQLIVGDPSAVPEPSTWLLIAAGTLLVGIRKSVTLL